MHIFYSIYPAVHWQPQLGQGYCPTQLQGLTGPSVNGAAWSRATADPSPGKLQNCFLSAFVSLQCSRPLQAVSCPCSLLLTALREWDQGWESGLIGSGKTFWFSRNGGEDDYSPALASCCQSAVGPGRISCSGRMGTSPLLLLGALRQGLQVELQHVPSILVSAEVPLGSRKKHPC